MRRSYLSVCDLCYCQKRRIVLITLFIFGMGDFHLKFSDNSDFGSLWPIIKSILGHKWERKAQETSDHEKVNCKERRLNTMYWIIELFFFQCEPVLKIQMYKEETAPEHLCFTVHKKRLVRWNVYVNILD